MKLHQIYTEILNEIGEGTSEPFEYEKTSQSPDGVKYTIFAKAGGKKLQVFLTVSFRDWYLFRSGVPEQDIINWKNEFNFPLVTTDETEPDPFMQQNFNSMYVVFGLNKLSKLGKSSGDGDFPLVNDKTYMFRLMATIKQILLPLIEQENINVVYYDPAKREGEEDIASTNTGRSRLYDIFIRSSFPGAKSINSTNKLRPYVYTLIRPISK